MGYNTRLALARENDEDVMSEELREEVRSPVHGRLSHSQRRRPQRGRQTPHRHLDQLVSARRLGVHGKG